MFNKPKIYIVISLLVVAICVAMMFAFKNPSNDSTAMKEVNSVEAIQQNTRDVEKPQVETIATKWQWQKIENRDTTANIDNDVTLPFTPQSVHDALQAVKIDENGNVILDHFALVSLDEALERIYKKLDGESLNELLDLINQALPGPAGEQTAKLVSDYSRFLGAKDEFAQVYEGIDDPSIKQSVATIESDQALYAELQALREVHLGSDVAQSLFEVSDANAQYMFESLKLSLNESLSAQERAARQTELESLFEQLTELNESQTQQN